MSILCSMVNGMRFMQKRQKIRPLNDFYSLMNEN